MHRGVVNGRADAWSGALHRLKSAELNSVRFPLEHYPYPELVRALQVSIDALDSTSRKRYLTMGVFPEDVGIPESTLRLLWDIGEYEMQSTVDHWLSASLASRNDQGRIALHDLQMDYVRKIVTPEAVTALHERLVDQYAASCGGDWSKVPNDGYFFQRIAWHMAHAERWRELEDMLLNNKYIRAKLDTLSYLELGQDFALSSANRNSVEDEHKSRSFVKLEAMIKHMLGFVDREEETARIENWIEAGLEPYMFILGAAGSGKSSLI